MAKSDWLEQQDEEGNVYCKFRSAWPCFNISTRKN